MSNDELEKLREKQKNDLDQIALEYAQNSDLQKNDGDDKKIKYLEIDDEIEDYENFE